MVVVFPPQNYFAWKFALTCVHAIAFFTGIARLVNRARRQLWWWDDTILVVPLIVQPTMMVLTWLRFPGDKPPRVEELPPHVIALHSFWATNLPFALVVWPCRMVLVLTMARVLPHQHRARIHSFIVAGIMAVCGIAMLLVNIHTCRKSKLLDRKDPRYCITVGRMPLGVFLGVIIDLGSDLFLVVFAFFLFRSIRLPTFERSVILLSFSGSVLTFLAVVVWVFMIYGPFSYGEDFAFMVGIIRSIEIALSVFACSLFIFSPFLLRMQSWVRAARNGGRSSQGVSRSLSFRTSDLSDPYPTHLVLTEISRTTTSHVSGKRSPDTITLNTMDRADLEDDGVCVTMSASHSQSDGTDFLSDTLHVHPESQRHSRRKSTSVIV